MLYFKNNDLAEMHRVTLRTVQNWVQAAKDGKLDLTLREDNGKSYVANTSRNIATIERLVKERRKYRNTKSLKTTTPLPAFYSIYNEEQIFDLVTNIEIYHEIPRQYNYFDGGASHWDEHAQRLSEEETPNIENSAVKLLTINRSYLDDLLMGYRQINVVDIGVGNAYPVRDLLARLLEQGKLGRYIALDISPAMLSIAKSNIQKWFDGKVAYEGYEHDINYERFSNLLAKEYLKKDAKDTANLILLLGGSMTNERDSDGGFRIIHHSMGLNDFLLHTKKLDTGHTRHSFDFDVTPGGAKLAPIHSLVVKLLDIDPSFYDIEVGYDPEYRQRFERIRFNVSLSIKFIFSLGERVVNVNKGDAILVWRGLQQTADEVREQFKRNGFYILHTSQTIDQEYMLTVARIRRD